MNENSRASKFRKDWKEYFPTDHVQNLIDAYRGGVKPYDSYVVHRGHFIGIEFKRIMANSINPKNGLRNNQVDGLFDATTARGTGLVIYFLDKPEWANKSIFVCTIKEYVKIFNGSTIGNGEWTWGDTRKINDLEKELPHCFIKKEKLTVLNDCNVETKKLTWQFDVLIKNHVKKVK